MAATPSAKHKEIVEIDEIDNDSLGFSVDRWGNEWDISDGANDADFVVVTE